MSNRWLERPDTVFFWFRAATLAILLLLGLFFTLGSHPLATKVQRGSYDWLYKLAFFNKPDISRDAAVIVYIDEASQSYLEQSRNAPWDRALHARLLDRLREEGAAAVVLDVIFSGPSNPESDQALEDAIRRNGRVILGVDMEAASQGNGEKAVGTVMTMILPEERFIKGAAGLGSVHLKADDDFVIREHFHLTPQENLKALAWSAAELAGLRSGEKALKQERWIKYYGGPETVPHVSFYQALDPNFQKGLFKGKTVFVGARPTTTLLVERRDETRSSYSSWSDRFIFMPAVEVHATLFLNLIRKDWLVRTPPLLELLLVAACAAFGGVLLTRLSPIGATLAGFGGAIVVIVAVLLCARLDCWAPWLTLVAVQLPLGLLASFLCSSVRWLIQRHKHDLEKQAAARRIFEQAALLDKAQDAIVAFDLDGNFTFWNRGAERIYGWTKEEITSRKIDTLAKDPARLETARSETLRSGEWNGELRNVNKDGIELLIDSRWSLDRHDNGTPKGFLIIDNDVTEKRKLENQLLRAQRMDSLGTLAGGIAHDLNNVLAPITMGVELIRMKKPDPKMAHLLDNIEKSSHRAAALIKQILTFARGSEGDAKLVNVRHLLKEMDKIFAETFPKNINIAIEMGKDLHPVMADVTQLHQVFLNLCVNARDAMPNGGKLRVRAECAGPLPAHLPATPEQRTRTYIVVKVADSGTGIPPEIAEKIFEPFFTTKEIGKGTGLGLATVITIVRKHQGFLDFTSKVGEGTEFAIYIPAAEQGADAAAEAHTKPVRPGKGELILVVDDEQPVRSMAEEILATVGYSVVTASHAQAALEIVAERREALGLVLIDRMMPGMDSIEAMRQMRLLEPTLPVICMSGITPATREELTGAADEFLQKPFTAEGLLKSIGERIESRGDKQPAAVLEP